MRYKYAETFRVFSGEKHLATITHTRGREYFFVTFENIAARKWETRVYKTESAMNAQITKYTNRILKNYGGVQQ